MRKISKNNLMWFLILIGFLYYFIHLIYTKKYLLFVHPRMYKFIVFGIILFALISIRQLTCLFKSTEKQSFKPGYILFFLVLIVAFLVNTNNISANLSSTRTVDIPNAKNGVLNSNPASTAANAQVSAQDTHKHDHSSTGNTKYIIKNNKVELNDSNMSYALDDMYTYPKKYENKSVTITGFVFRDKGFSSNEFVVGRLLMTCCTADTAVVGIIVNLNNAQSYKTNTWVTVSGTLKLRKAINPKIYNNDIMPYIVVNNIKIIKAPENQYIY